MFHNKSKAKPASSSVSIDPQVAVGKTRGILGEFEWELRNADEALEKARDAVKAAQGARDFVAQKVARIHAAIVAMPELEQARNAKPYDQVLLGYLKKLKQGSWAKYQASGASDDQILSLLKVGWPQFLNASDGTGATSEYQQRPRFFFEARGYNAKATLEGKSLAAEARRLLEIPQPKAKPAPSAKPKPAGAKAKPKPPAKSGGSGGGGPSGHALQQHQGGGAVAPKPARTMKLDQLCELHEKPGAQAPGKHLPSDTAADWLERLDLCKTADEARRLFDEHERAVEKLQRGMGQTPLCGRVNPRSYVGFTVVSAGQWEKAIAVATKIGAFQGVALRHLVEAGKAIRGEKWEKLLAAERGPKLSTADLEKQLAAEGFEEVDPREPTGATAVEPGKRVETLEAGSTYSPAQLFLAPRILEESMPPVESGGVFGNGPDDKRGGRIGDVLDLRGQRYTVTTASMKADKVVYTLNPVRPLGQGPYVSTLPVEEWPARRARFAKLAPEDVPLINLRCVDRRRLLYIMGDQEIYCEVPKAAVAAASEPSAQSPSELLWAQLKPDAVVTIDATGVKYRVQKVYGPMGSFDLDVVPASGANKTVAFLSALEIKDGRIIQVRGGREVKIIKAAAAAPDDDSKIVLAKGVTYHVADRTVYVGMPSKVGSGWIPIVKSSDGDYRAGFGVALGPTPGVVLAKAVQQPTSDDQGYATEAEAVRAGAHRMMNYLRGLESFDAKQPMPGLEAAMKALQTFIDCNPSCKDQKAEGRGQKAEAKAAPLTGLLDPAKSPNQKQTWGQWCSSVRSSLNGSGHDMALLDNADPELRRDYHVGSTPKAAAALLVKRKAMAGGVSRKANGAAAPGDPAVALAGPLAQAVYSSGPVAN